MFSDQAREGHRFLEHVTDAFVEAWGETLQEAFSQAALALFEAMIEVRAVKPVTTLNLEAAGHDKLELLYNWLEELLLRFEIDGLVFGSFRIESVDQKENGLTLTATVRGEPYEPRRHGRKAEVKGITYHQMSIEKISGERTVVRFILDL